MHLQDLDALDLALQVFNGRLRRVLKSTENQMEHEGTSLLDGVTGHVVLHALGPEGLAGVVLEKVEGELEIFLRAGLFWDDPGVAPCIASRDFSNMKLGTVSEEIVSQRVSVIVSEDSASFQDVVSTNDGDHVRSLCEMRWFCKVCNWDFRFVT